MTGIRQVLDALGVAPDAAGSASTTGTLTRPAPLAQAGPGDLSFCTAGMVGAAELLRLSRASMVIVDTAVLDDMHPGSLAGTIVRSKSARLDFICVLHRFFTPASPEPDIHLSAVIASGARIGEGVAVGPLCTIADDVEIGSRSVLHAGVHVYPGVRIGARVIVHSGTVIGADGYGYERDATGVLERFPHLGGVVIEDDVEIGSNVSIDRGALEDTWIGPRARIDNLVHVAHNVHIGADAAIIAHAMLGGSSSVGDGAWIAPCAVLREGVPVGANALVGVGSVVTGPVQEGLTVAGNPAREIETHRAIQGALKQLAEAHRQKHSG